MIFRQAARALTSTSSALMEFTNAPRPSATIIIAAHLSDALRPAGGHDGFDYKVLMIQRSSRGAFKNSYVYPGGVVDKADEDPKWLEMFPQTELPSGSIARRICGIREAFEECGLLLAEPDGEKSVKIDEKDIARWREEVHNDASRFLHMMKQYHLRPLVERLFLFSHWITPTFETKRFDTPFFLITLPALPSGPTNGQDPTALVASSFATATTIATPDHKENVQLNWFTPAQALREFEQGNINYFPPQFYTLQELSCVPRLEDLSRKFGAREVSPILPEYQFNEDNVGKKEANDEDGPFLALPGDAEHTWTLEVPGSMVSKRRHRIYVAPEKPPFKKYRLVMSGIESGSNAWSKL
ncbi:uncharacterized protein VTP21DRAFT_10493 [Calcarisporiella thermophila]|uniref:uncharacterized protein n=1 Tax=Calcarisporiella thermophila TaxID=911321 RepID=UPI0037433D86